MDGAGEVFRRLRSSGSLYGAVARSDVFGVGFKPEGEGVGDGFMVCLRLTTIALNILL
jgi:hypothetical protein